MSKGAHPGEKKKRENNNGASYFRGEKEEGENKLGKGWNPPKVSL